MNRSRGEITSGANSTTVVTATINTGMNVGRASAYKWVILGAQLMPKHDEAAVAIVAAAGTANRVCSQLCIGTQTAFLDGDDMQVIAEAQRSIITVTSGGWEHMWPLQYDILYPLPVFAQTLTILLKSVVDNAGLQNITWTYTIWYVMSNVADREMLEHLQAFGQV